jgi:hypothetical protein
MFAGLSAHIPMLPEMISLVSNYLPATYSTATVTVILSVVLLLYTILNGILYRLSAPTRELPGPKSVNWLTGSHTRDVWEPDALEDQLEWTRQYGSVFKYYGWFNVSVILYLRHDESGHPMISR